MSASSVSSSRAHATSVEAIAAWNDLTVSAADGRVRVVTIETGRTKAQNNPSPGQHDSMGPMPATVQQGQAANDAPPKHDEPSVAAGTQAQSQPADDAAALLNFALGLGEHPDSTEFINAAPEPGGAAVQPAQGLPAQPADKPDATVSLSLATQTKGEPHAGI
jgi:hypothetical protein